MTSRRLCILLVILFICQSCPNSAVRADGLEIHVSPAGADTNAGTSQAPFLTLERARDRLRESDAGVSRRVILHAGTYAQAQSFVLTREDAGAAEHPVVWQAAAGEKVRLIGGIALPAAAFHPVTDAPTLARIIESARPHVLHADLRALGLTNIKPYPNRFRGAPDFPELFVNEVPMTVARWPNAGWSTIATIVEQGGSALEPSDKTGVFEPAKDRAARWDAARGVWIRGCWAFDWHDEVIRVKSIDAKSNRITLAEPTQYGIRLGSPSARRFCALNLLEELDVAGEYYIDPEAGQLYFWPPVELQGASVILSTLETPVVVLKETSHVTLRGLGVGNTLGEAIEIQDGSDNSIEACEISNTRGIGVRVAGGAHHRVVACDVHETGAGGIGLAGGDRKTLTPGGHVAFNNHIWRYSRLQLAAAAAISLSGVGNTAAHNLIHHAPHWAIAIFGNDHVVEFNVIHDVVSETGDAGAIYKGRNLSCRGNAIRYNFFHHVGVPHGRTSAAIYFDDGDCGDTVLGNVFFLCGSTGGSPFGTVLCNGGDETVAENNIFIGSDRALGARPWNAVQRRQVFDHDKNPLAYDKLFKEVDVRKEPYTSHYPSLQTLLHPKPGEPLVNHSVKNVFVHCNNISNGNWVAAKDDQWVGEEDPGFVDAAKGDFRLKPESEIFKALPGFTPPPFEKMGLVADELRPAPPVEAWTYPLPWARKGPATRAAKKAAATMPASSSATQPQ